MPFKAKQTDYELSPYTGLTRESFIEAGEYLLEGIFRHIKSFDAPVVVARQETAVTYPHLNASEETRRAEEKAEIFEGLTRSMFIAAPLIHDNPELTVCGYCLRDYYKNQILRVCTKDDPFFVGTYETLQEMTGHADKFRAFQQTVETCALVICLWVCREEIWDTYTKAEKDIIAGFLSDFAHANTVPQNWRLFNMLDLAFLHMEGYDIDEEIMLDHAQAILEYYAGDGWYRDGQSFDYYSCWAFNFYGPLWNVWYGYEHLPYIAQRIEANSNKLMETYMNFFDEDGYTNMWGRSNIYRFAAVSPFDGNFLLKNHTMNPGLARRITAGSLLQFLSRDDFLSEGIPTLGFYGQFSPLVQGYSCAESPFWLGKAFMCLHLPKEHPFWCERENNGIWEKADCNAVNETTLNGPALCFTNHKANGETILRTGKIIKNIGDVHGLWNYAKLSFNSKYPWEATPLAEGADCVAKGEVEAQQYVLKDLTDNRTMLPNAVFWCGNSNGILYRKQFFDYRTNAEMHWIQNMYLADFPVPLGIMRVDKLKLHRRPVEMRLGAYGFPDNDTEVIRLTEGAARAIILKGRDSQGRDKQLAMTIYAGFDGIDYIKSTGTNPDSAKSIVIYATARRSRQYGGCEPYVLISQVITKESAEDFKPEEIFPIEAISYEDAANCGTYGAVALKMKNGEEKAICYEGLEGRLSL